MKKIFALLSAVIGIVCASSANAAVITLNDIARGAYNNSGTFGTGGSGTATGNYITENIYHSFFGFDLASISGTVTSATLILAQTGGGSTPVNLSIWDVSTNYQSLVGNQGGIAAYNDLSSGMLFGSIKVTPASTGTISVTLNDDALQAINVALGSKFALGGSLLESTYLFPSSLGAPLTQLRLTTADVPEPAPLALLGLGFAGMSLLRRKKQS
ncbi:MAG TPA: PEP-CTERM sorting domain-containing protein [Telluria sp.]|jgi:hypothetical protein